MIGGHGFLGLVLIAIAKMEILYTFYQFQDTIKVITRYEGWYYIQFYSYYIMLYFESDWSRIRPLPSTTLKTNEEVLFMNAVGFSAINAVKIQEY